jgi:hypothetical protein
MRSWKNIILVLVTVFAILIQLAVPTLAYADGETDPPPPTEVIVEPPPPTEESVTNEVPVATEVPVTGEISTEVPVVTEVPSVADTLLADPTVVEEPELLEVLEQLPAETDVMVLDETGEVVPLATQEAAEIIVVGDPVWCEAGSMPNVHNLGCSSSFTSLSELVAGFVPTDDGTIWIENVEDSGSEVKIDGYGSWWGASGFKLTLQGGWDGAFNGLGTITATNSVFDVPISIVNWTGAVTVNNITIDGTTGTGLEVTTKGNINLSDVTAVNNTDNGAHLNNCYLMATLKCGGTGDVTLTGTNTFSGNGSYGLWVESTGAIEVNNVTANNNADSGGRINNTAYWSYISVPITLRNSNFIGNGYTGLSVGSYGDITLQNVIASGNAGDYGALLGNTYGTGNVALIGTNIFNNNHGTGLSVDTDGNITLENVTADGNSDGIFLYQGVAGPAISISNVTTRNNCYGLFLDSSNDTAVNVGNIADNTVGIRKANDTDPLVLNHVTFSGNTTNIASGFVDCENQNGGGGGSVTTLIAPQQQVEFILDCLHQQFYPVTLPNGDQVKIVCPVSGKASITRLDNTMLPAGLPEGYTYASAFSLEVFQGVEAISYIDEGGHIKMSFRVSSMQAGSDYSILYWDNGGWAPLKDFMLDENGQPRSFNLHPNDPRKILSGLNFVSTGNSSRAETSTNFPGIFVLVQH